MRVEVERIDPLDTMAAARQQAVAHPADTQA
jgi:hypothetical protein